MKNVRSLRNEEVKVLVLCHVCTGNVIPGNNKP